MGRFWNLAGLIVGGIIAADVLSQPKGTKAFFDGLGGLWKTSANGLLGQPTK